MQDDSSDFLGEFLAAAPTGASTDRIRELRQQAELFARQPDRRFTSAELVALAREHHETFTPRLLSDWPKWGLLAEAQREGRGPRQGVGRTWSAAQTNVFLSVVLVRSHGKRRRADLANIPAFAWLLFGEDHVPLEQARRALSTWAAAVPDVSSRKLRTDLYHHLLRHPDIQARLASGLESKQSLQAHVRHAPTHADREQVPAFVAQILRTNSVDEETVEQATRRYEESQAALDRGLAYLPNTNDSTLRAARRLYLQYNVEEPIRTRKFPTPEQLQQHFRAEATAACANAITFLDFAAEEAELVRLTTAAGKASLAYSRLLGLAALTERNSRESIDRSWNRRTKRTKKRRRK